MATQLFTLKVTDGTDTADFVDGTEFKVLDGGFDIGTPQVDRQFYQYARERNIPVMERYLPRDCTIDFEVHGTTRQNVLSSIHKLERLILKANEQFYLDAKVELQYAWEGADNITYFEVVGGDPSLPTEMFSIERMHEVRDGKIVVHGLRLSLKLSSHGYSISPVNGSMTEVPLKNTYQPTKTTGGIAVRNPGDTNTNYVEIEAADVAGGSRLLTRIELTSGTPWEPFEQVFIGHRITPFPTGALLLEAEDASGKPAGSSTTANTAASGDDYELWTQLSASTPLLNPVFSHFHWFLDQTQVGTFMCFSHHFSEPNDAFWWAVGQSFYTTDWRNFVGKWKKHVGGQYKIPLGVIQNPWEDKLLNTYGDGNQYSMIVALHHGSDTLGGNANADLDAFYLLPVDHGLRVWVSRGHSDADSKKGKFVDDGFLNAHWLKRADNGLTQINWFTLFDPIRLYPNVNQRLYFNMITEGTSADDIASQYTVRLYAMNTHLTLAL